MKLISRQNGNALVIVLLTLGLFAALSFAITQSSRNTSTSQIAEQDVMLAVQNMLRHSLAIENAINTMRSLNNVASDEISFESDDSPHDYSNGNCGSDICEVFSMTGGGIFWKNPPSAATAGVTPPTGRESYQFLGSDPIYGHGSDGTTAANSDLYMLVLVNASACQEINRAVGVTHGREASPAAAPLFQGSYSYNSAVIDDDELNGNKAFCAEHSDGSYQYIYVLLPR